MKVPIDTVIWDFDGVLVDTAPDIAGAANFTLRSLGFPELPPQTISNYIGGGAEALLRRLLDPHGALDLVPNALPIFVQRYEDCCCVDSVLYPGVKDVLEKFRRAGKRQSIATQKIERITRKIMNGLEIDSYFETVIGPESVTHRKPHPESILLILEHTETEPKRAIIVGDTNLDIQAGKAAKIWTCGVRYGYGTKEEIAAAEPDLALDSLIQLLDWIE
jgi:phosphoglycolate phosphatase